MGRLISSAFLIFRVALQWGTSPLLVHIFTFYFTHFNIFYVMSSIVQRNPERHVQYIIHQLIKNRSPTDSIESFNNLAHKEAQILHRNPRKAKYEVTWHILKPLDIPELRRVRDKVFGYLRKVKLNAVISIEPTTDGFGNPNDCVHFHILTDDDRGVEFLRELVKTASLSAGLKSKSLNGVPKNEFDIECRSLPDYDGYIRYFTKHNREDEVYLFIRGSRIKRFYTIGDWYIDADGNRESKGDKWNAIIQETRDNHAKAEKQDSKPIYVQGIGLVGSKDMVPDCYVLLIYKHNVYLPIKKSILDPTCPDMTFTANSSDKTTGDRQSAWERFMQDAPTHNDTKN